jgi:hypothetical protein
MNISGIAKQVGKFTSDNSPAILTAIGGLGVVGTAYAASKATIKAHAAVKADDAEREALKEEPRTKKETVKLVWILYLPTVTSGVLTITAIVMANRISTGRAAALAAAYALNQQGWEEFEKKAKEVIGEKEVEKVKAQVAQDRVNQSTGQINDVIFIDDSEQLFLEGFSRRPFKSTRNELDALQNKLNKLMIDGDTVSLSELYDFLGLSHTDMSGELGWNADTLIEFTFHPTVVAEGQHAGKTCFVMGTNMMPFREYRSNH